MVETFEKSSDERKQDYKAHGFDLYPERRSVKPELSYLQKFTMAERGQQSIIRTCEKNVLKAIKKNPLVKLLMGALKESGCPINIRRHIVCENCETVVTGGYDQELNQIVVCQNMANGRKMPDSTLIHELIHMYDYCVNHIDFRNLEHLACTEIRAANLSHCSFISSWLLGQSSPINIRNTHQYCVKMKAAQSMILSRNISFETAMESILKVFDKCYSDLEPIGRRVRRNSPDKHLALSEAVALGFCQS